MTEMQIKAESMSKRCEICHQVDCFDPQNNYCSRCESVKVNGEQINQIEAKQDLKQIQNENLQYYRTLAKWPTIISSLLFVLIDFIVETKYIGWIPSPHNIAPSWLNAIFEITGWFTFLFGVLTFLRWYSFLAWASLIWVALCIAGR